jgi:hypothetical protein
MWARSGSTTTSRRPRLFQLQAVGAAERVEPAAEALIEVLQRGGGTHGLGGDALHGGERVLDPVAELGHQQLLLLLAVAALGDVGEGQDDAVDIIFRRAVEQDPHDVGRAGGGLDLALDALPRAPDRGDVLGQPAVVQFAVDIGDRPAGITLTQAEQLGGRGREVPDPELVVEKHHGQADVLEQVLEVVVGPGQVVDMAVQLQIDGLKLFVDRLQLLLRGLKLLLVDCSSSLTEDSSSLEERSSSLEVSSSSATV